MAQCSLSAREFIQNTFGPTVAVVCSHDAEVLAQKNNLSFVEMLRPFCRLTSEAHIRDPAGQSHSIHNLCLIIQEMNTQPPSAAIHKKLCHDAVQNSQLPLSEGQTSVLSVGSYDLQISASTPWYEAYRESVLQSMATSDHEFIRHFVACMLVVSTGHADPMDQFAKLSQQQHHLQHSSNTTHPKWLCPNIFKYYVLLHDNSEGEEEKADAIYQSMKSTYGSHACHLLRINSRAKTTVDATSMASEQMCMPDPWSQYLNKVNQQDPMENDASPANDPSMFPDQVSEGTSPATEDCNIVLTPNSSEDFPNDPSPEDIVMVQVDGSPNSEMVPHPLADVDSQSNHTVASPTDPLSNPPTDPLSNPPTDPLTDSLITNNANGSNSVPQTGKGANQGTAPAPVKTPGGSNVHGAHLTLSDHDRLRIFVHEFVVRGLLPYIERMIRSLSEQLASRKGIQRSLFNATKKLFMGNKQNEKLLSAPQSDSSPKYLRESPEIQMRRRADLAFMVQMYELAYTSYHTAKGDFGNDQAWMHYAGSLEFAAISAFMLGHIQKSYPSHYMENAVTTYLTTCKQPHLATRAVLIGTEIQKARFVYSEAALEFIRLTGEDSDLRSALFLEQAAHCFINSSRPMVRKYAFHMILAGHRFSKAGQRKHALRSYCQALQVYKGKGWALAEDHINLTVGRQSFNLKQLENATAAFKHLLTRDSRQPAVQQVAFLREYLAIFKQLLTIQYADGQTLGALPQLPLPVIKKSATRILLASPDRPQYSDNRVAATSVTFGCIFNKTEMEEWCSMEEAVAMAANKTKVVPSWFQFHPQLLHSGTDNSISPVGILGEPMTVELVLENPLKISLVLTNITLLWKFLPVNYEGGNQENPEHQPQVLTNEPHVSGSDVPGVDSAVKVQCIPEVVLAGNDYKLLRLGLTPLQTGELHIVGVAYNLSAQSSGQTTGQGSDPLNQEVVNAHGRPVVKRPVSFTSGPAQVQGRQDLDIQGPRLNSTKAERCGMLYGPDRRLDPVIAPHMPLLEVTFSSMPSNLMCGEIVKVTMEISNVGKCPLHKLHTIVDRPEIFSFVSHAHEVSSNSSSSQSQTSSISDSSAISQSADGHSGRTIPISEEGLCAAHSVDTGKCNVSSVSEIVLPEGQLAPGCSLQMPMWIRGPDDSGLHDVRVLFFYETTEENTQIRHRTLQHTATIHTSNSVSLTARADRAHTIDGRTSDSHDPNSLNLVVSLTVENMNQVHDSSITEISLQQVTSVSPWWRLSPLSGMESECKIGSGESQKLCFKARQIGNTNGQMLTFSSVLFGKDKAAINSMPCTDFYLRSKLKGVAASAGVSLPFSSMGTPVGSGSTAENGTQGWLVPGGQTQSGGPLQECCAADLALLVLWKAFVVDEEGRDHTLYGQSHLLLDQLSAEVLSHPVRKLPVEQKQIKFAKQPVSQDPVLPSPGVMTSLVKYSLKYSEMLHHDFTRNRICPLPVMLTLCNCTDSALDVVIETTSAIENESTSDASRARVGPPSSVSTSSSGFSWVGQSSRHLSLGCRQDQQVQILSCCSQPGVFDLSGLRVLAAPAGATWAREPVLQQRMSSCLLTVTAV